MLCTELQRISLPPPFKKHKYGVCVCVCVCVCVVMLIVYMCNAFRLPEDTFTSSWSQSEHTCTHTNKQTNKQTMQLCHMQNTDSLKLSNVCVIDYFLQTSDTAINLDHEEWILDKTKTLEESSVSE